MAINYLKFGRFVKNQRKSMGYSQKDVYHLTGISVETQRLLENGYREPRLITLERLSEVYKTDLIFYLVKYRTENDLFSEVFLDKMALNFSEKNFDDFIDDIDAMIDVIHQEYLQDGHKTKENMKFVEALKSFKDLKLDRFRFNMSNAVFYEQLLHFFSTNKAEMLSDSAIYYFEAQVAILLAIAYRKSDRFDDSEKVLKRLIARLEPIEYKTVRQSDYLASAYYNLSYLYHRQNRYEDTIDIVDLLYKSPDIRMKRAHFCDLLLRKAIAQFRLNNENYKHTFAVVLSMEPAKRAADVLQKTKEIYGIDITEFMDMSDVAGFEDDQIKTK